MKQTGKLGQAHAPLAFEPDHQFIAQTVQIAHIGGSIFALRLVEDRPAPIRALLLFGHALAQQFISEVFEPVAAV